MITIPERGKWLARGWGRQIPVYLPIPGETLDDAENRQSRPLMLSSSHNPGENEPRQKVASKD